MTVGATADDRAIEDVASVQKSVVSVLAALASDRGLLDPEAFVTDLLGAGWSGATPAQERRIRVRHLLSMTSGLGPGLVFEAEPGSRWRYNTQAYSKLLPVLEKASGAEIEELTASWLTQRIGMLESGWAPRAWLQDRRVDANVVGFTTTARDLARFGLLVLAGGRWHGESLFDDASWLQRSLAPSQQLNPAYGLLWWLNGQPFSLRGAGTGRQRREGSLIPSAPADLVAAMGALGRRCYVVPSLGLVVTRLGAAPEARFDQRFWELLMAAAPRSE